MTGSIQKGEKMEVRLGEIQKAVKGDGRVIREG
jgi:hypothetical protein